MSIVIDIHKQLLVKIIFVSFKIIDMLQDNFRKIIDMLQDNFRVFLAQIAIDAQNFALHFFPTCSFVLSVDL